MHINEHGNIHLTVPSCHSLNLTPILKALFNVNLESLDEMKDHRSFKYSLEYTIFVSLLVGNPDKQWIDWDIESIFDGIYFFISFQDVLEPWINVWQPISEIQIFSQVVFIHDKQDRFWIMPKLLSNLHVIDVSIIPFMVLMKKICPCL